MQKIGDIPNTRADSNGEFTDGNVAGGVPPTLLPAEWFNTIQRELVTVVQDGGLTLDPNDDTQVLAALKKLFLQSGNNLSEIKDAGPTAITQTLANLGLGEVILKTDTDIQLAGNVTAKGGLWDTAPGAIPLRVWSPNNKPLLNEIGVVDASISTKGIVQLATNAEMATGLSTSLVPSVAALMSLFSKREFGGNSYIRIPDIPDGLVIQWGYVPNMPIFQSFVTVTFPFAFPNNAQAITVARTFTSAATAGQANPTVRSVVGTGFEINSGDAASVNMYWIAIGY
ncbi:gp53-like domain-containing protein [Yersinia pseudotuberculosis]|uniref:gp53-like domain-containing protein n=1 Tax=Yersinia pseudotuberculosis TaxID=633 RepID=UPI0005DBAFFC|nr:hypothetical protein [Yersinia pseudotuberculosis]CNB84711.1 bacteriophage tail fiber protein [Yersinia pseudotuberculosis]